MIFLNKNYLETIDDDFLDMHFEDFKRYSNQPFNKLEDLKFRVAYPGTSQCTNANSIDSTPGGG